jgi:UDP-N-acetyl-D-glucosamine dehydrogenase
MGMAYKKDIDDVRESPALDILMLLQQRGAKVTYSDPFVPCIKLMDGGSMHASDPMDMAKAADCVVIVTDHSKTDYGAVVDTAKLIVDSRNALKKFSSENIVRL